MRVFLFFLVLSFGAVVVSCKKDSSKIVSTNNATITTQKEKPIQQNSSLSSKKENDSYFIYKKWESTNQNDRIFMNDEASVKLTHHFNEEKNEGGLKLYIEDKEIDFIVSDAYVLTPYWFTINSENILLIREEDEGGVYGYIVYYLKNKKLIKKTYLNISPEKEYETPIDSFIKFKNTTEFIQPIILNKKYYDVQAEEFKDSKNFNVKIKKN